MATLTFHSKDFKEKLVYQGLASEHLIDNTMFLHPSNMLFEWLEKNKIQYTLSDNYSSGKDFILVKSFDITFEENSDSTLFSLTWL